MKIMLQTPVVIRLLLSSQFDNHDRVVSANVGIPHSIAIRLDNQLFFIMIMYSRPRPRISSRIIRVSCLGVDYLSFSPSIGELTSV